MLDVLVEALLEWVKLIPFLFIAFLIVEFAEHKASYKMHIMLANSGKFGSVFGAFLGAVPQCGFSVMATNLYSGRVITVGTLISVYLSTSDEAIPILFANGLYKELVSFIIIKIIIGIAAGFLVDCFIARVMRIDRPREHRHDLEKMCEHCGCEHGIVWSAIYHTIKTATFILAFVLVFNFAVYFIGEESFRQIILSDSFFQPFVTSLFGFIPNCASSELLTQFYVEGAVSRGALLAGLCTNAGVATAVLFQMNKNIKENIKIMGIIYVVSVICGIIYQIIV